jgi:hypothetical protein
MCGFTQHKALAMMKNMDGKMRAPPGGENEKVRSFAEF